jgi:hypothetical protein
VRRLKAKRPHSIVGAGRVLQALGYDISEHPRFGGVEPVHAPNSKHYPPCSCAIDINWRGGGSERVRLTWASHWLRSRGFFVLWLVPDHYDHLHADAR